MAMPFAELIAYRQAHAQIWEQILFSSGGALELKKCFWYLVYWQWVNGCPQMAPNIPCLGIIAFTSGNVPNYTLQWSLDSKCGRHDQLLGFNLLLMATTKEGNFLLHKANQYATRLSTSRLSKMDMFIFHQSTYVPLMTYSLPVMMFDM